MSRELVEAIEQGSLFGTFPDLNPVTVCEAPPTGVLLRDLTNGRFNELLLNRYSQIYNNDDVAHTFDYALVGTDVPGGSVNLNPLIGGTLAAINIAAGGAQYGGPYMPLKGDQAVEVTMAVALSTLEPSFNTSWEDRYKPLGTLDVVGAVPDVEIALVNDSTPYVLAGPGDAFSTRRVLYSTPPTPGGFVFVNQDTVAHTITITLVDPDNGDTVLVDSLVLASGNSTAGVLPAYINLKGNQSLQVETATPTTTTDPYVWALWNDLI